MLNNFNDLDNYYVSNKFNITTAEIISLQNKIVTWISNGIPGAIIYGRSRIGKTKAILYISEKVREKYGSEIPIYIHNATEHMSKDRYFYSEFLNTIGHPEFDRGTVSVLKNRLMNALISAACATKHKKIILFIDEAYHFSEKDFNWLMDIYNNLILRDIHMSVFLVGSEELKARRQAFVIARQRQIVGRFMVAEFQFHGLRSAKDVSICLYNFDISKQINEEALILTECYFPDAYKDQKKLVDCSEDLWDMFQEIKKENNIPMSSEIPMMYMINTIKYCLNTYGKPGSGVYFPTKVEWKESIKCSDYVGNEGIYYNVSAG